MLSLQMLFWIETVITSDFNGDLQQSLRLKLTSRGTATFISLLSKAAGEKPNRCAFSSTEVTELKKFLHEVKRPLAVILLSDRRRFGPTYLSSDQY